MALFYFDFCQRSEIIEDNCGLEFRDTETAYLAAYEAALGMWADLLRERKDPRRCAFRVRDVQGAILFFFHFQEALDSCREEKWLCSPMTGTYRDSLRLVQQARQLSVDFKRELDKAHEALEEAKRLIDVSMPSRP